jgi:hypothetical protein
MWVTCKCCSQLELLPDLLMGFFAVIVSGTDNDICKSRPERVRNATEGTGRGFACALIYLLLL